VLEELQSAKTIINILQRELPTNTTTKNTCGEQTNTKEWTSVSSRNNSARPNKNKLCVPKTTDQHIVTTNRFTPLYNLQANNVESNGLQTLQGQKKQTGQISTQNENKTPNQHRKGMKIPTIINGRLIHGDDWKPTKKKKEEKTSTTGTSSSHKVKILGDSHLRETASKIDQYLNTKYEVSSWIKPGANTEETVNTLVEDLKCLGTQDVIVMNGGSKDIGSKRNQIHKVLVQMKQFIQENTHSNIIIVNIPPRHDMNRNSVTNLEIQAANRKLNKIVKAYNNVTIIESNLHRKYFT